MKSLRSEPLVWLLLCIGVGAVYAQTLDFGFVSVDDITYVRSNPWVSRGLTVDGVFWAFSTAHSSNWIPLTWISYMLECSLFGVDPGALHGTNAAIHAASSCLLFSALLRLSSAERSGTGAESQRIDPFWPSATVAVLFALHPTHVESVAWIAERKDVLSGFFWMLTLLAYAAYVRHPVQTRGRFGFVLAAFALGLLSKSMVVTLPCVLLLLDVWPLRRIDADSPSFRTARPLLIEKLPLFALAIVAAMITYAAQQSSGAMQTLEVVSLSKRLANAPIAYVRYLAILLWPVDLGFHYPRLTPEQLSLVRVVAALTVLGILTTASILLRNNAPYLLVGWLWFSGTLVPVIGWVQVGEQSLADRYTYLPSIGLFIALSFGAAAVWPRNRLARAALGTLACALLIGCTLNSRQQASTWKDNISLWSRAVAVTRNNATAHDQLGVAYFSAKNIKDALPHHQRAVELRPDSQRNRTNLGNALLASGRGSAARAEFQRILDVDPDSTAGMFGMASSLRALGDFAGALDQYETVLTAVPTLIEHGPVRRDYATALRSYLDMPGDHFDVAIARYRRAIALKPTWRSITTELVWALATDPRASRAHAEEGLAITEREPGPFAFSSSPSARRLDARAATLAAVDRFDEAIKAMERALDITRSNGNDAKTRELDKRIALYRTHQRYVERP